MYNRIVGLIGPTGSGKSYTAARMMSETERCAVYQLKRPHEELAFVMVADDVIDGNAQQFALALGEQLFHLVYLCSPPIPDKKQKNLVVTDLDPFIRACYTRERMTMVIDEAHFFCDPWHIPIYFRQAVVMGRSRYLDIIYCAQKFSTISKELTANTHELFLWRISEPGDLASLGERCGTDVAEAVSNLRPSQDQRRTGGEFQPGQYIHWRNTGEWEIVDAWTPKPTSVSDSESQSVSSLEESTPLSTGPKADGAAVSVEEKSGPEESISET